MRVNDISAKLHGLSNALDNRHRRPMNHIRDTQMETTTETLNDELSGGVRVDPNVRRPMSGALAEIAARVRYERETAAIKYYKYREEYGHFSVELRPS